MERPQADIFNSGAGMSRFLHPVASRQRLLMALASSTGGPAEDPWSRDCVVAGLLGTAEQWDGFEAEWKRVKDIEPAHSSVGRTHSALSDPRGAPRVSSGIGGRLEGLIGTSGLTAIGCSVAGDEYGRLSLEIRQSLTGGRPAEPCVLSFRHCILEAASQAEKLPPEEKVCFVFDGQDDLSSQAAWLFEEIKSLEAAPVRERLGALGFEPKRHFAPLQAAEWLARELLNAPRKNGAPLELRGQPRAHGSHLPRLIFKSFDRRAFRLLQIDWEKRHVDGNWSVSGM